MGVEANIIFGLAPVVRRASLGRVMSVHNESVVFLSSIEMRHIPSWISPLSCRSKPAGFGSSKVKLFRRLSQFPASLAILSAKCVQDNYFQSEMLKCSTLSTSDKIVFINVCEDGQFLHLSALILLGSYIWLHQTSHSNYMPMFEYAADLYFVSVPQLPEVVYSWLW